MKSKSKFNTENSQKIRCPKGEVGKRDKRKINNFFVSLNIRLKGYDLKQLK